MNGQKYFDGFEHGYLDDNIYMVQSGIFIAKGQNHLVFKLPDLE